MKLLIIFAAFILFTSSDNPNLNQDIIYPKAYEIEIGTGETCDVVSEDEMLKARKIFHKYWEKNLADSTWVKYNRQYLIYNSKKLGKVIYINGVCLEKSASYFKTTWCYGMDKANCYYTAFVDLKKKKVVLFTYNTFDK